MTRVIIITDTLNIDGGAARIAKVTVEGLKVEHNNVIVITGDKIEGIPKNNFFSLNLHPFSSLMFPLSSLFSISSYFKLKKILKKIKFNDNDIIHVHSWVKNLSPSIFMHFKRNKVLITTHDYFLACPNGGFFNYKFNKKCELKALAFKCLISNCDKNSYIEKLGRVLRQYITNHLIKRIVNLNLVYVSNYTKKIIFNYFPLTSSKVINNPIIKLPNLKKITPENNSKIIYIGRISKEKGIDNLVYAAKKSKTKITFIGSLSNEYLSLFKNNPDYLEHIPWLNDQKLSLFLNKVRFLIFPSIWHETQGMVPFELGRIGIPSLIYQENATSSFFKNNFDCVKFNSTESLISKVQILKNDNILIKKLSTNLKKKRYKTTEIYIKELKNFYFK